MSAELGVKMPTDVAVSLIADTTNTIASNANTVAENEVLYNLVRDNSASLVKNKITSSVYKNTSGSNTNLVSTSFTDAEISNCELLTNLGEHDGSFAISTYHSTNNVSYNVVASNIDNASVQSYPKSFLVDQTSSSLYDSHLSIEIASNNGPFNSPNDSNRISATFTSDGNYASVVNFQKAINSRFGNTTNQDVLTYTEDVSFNTTYALGKSQNSYYTLNSNGSLTANSIPTAYTADQNGFTISQNDLSLLTDTDFGTYRFQQLPPAPEVRVKQGTTVKSDTNATEFPVTVTTNKNVGGPYYIDTLPSNDNQMSITTFDSLFDINDSSATYPLPKYEFKMEVTPGDAGFSFNNSDYSSTGKTNDIVTMTDDGLYNNIDLMQNWINNDCELKVTNGSLSIQTSTDGASTNLSAMTLSTGREKLADDKISTNGQIIINARKIHERTLIDSNTTDLTPVVYYDASNLLTQPLKKVTEEFKTNYNVEFESQLVMKKPTANLSKKFLSSGDSALNLIVNNVNVNGNFSTNNWDFTSNVTATLGSTEVIRIIPQNRLDDVDSFKNSLGQVVNNMNSSVYVSNLKYPMTGELKAELKLMLRQYSELSFADEFLTANWILSSGGSKLHATSAFANESDGVAWPNADEAYNLVNGTISELKYKLEFLTNDFKNNIIVNWGTLTTEENMMYIPQENITTTPMDQDIKSIETVLASEYTKSGNFLTRKSIELRKYTTTKKYKLSFPLLLRPYTNLTVETPTYTVTSIYYIVFDVATQAPMSNQNQHLKNIVKVGTTTNYYGISESVTAGTTSVLGTLNINDLRELTANIIVNTPNGDITITNPKNVSSFYSSTSTKIDIMPEYSTNFGSVQEVELLLDFVAYDISGNSNLLELNHDLGYNISLSNNISYPTDFLIQYWSHNISDFGLYSDLSGSNIVISPETGFAGIGSSNWTNNESLYSLTSTFEGTSNSTTVLSIYKQGSLQPQYVIKLKNDKIYSTPMYISTGSQDVWRIVRTVGQTVTTRFRGTTYIETGYVREGVVTGNQPAGYNNRVALDEGVYLDKLNASTILHETIDFDTVVLGSSIKFKLKSDKVTVNLIGNTSDTLLASFTENGLQFKYESGGYISRTVTFAYYRGYYKLDTSASDANQIYTIVRTKSTAEFKFYTPLYASKYSQVVDVKVSQQLLNDFKLNDTAITNKFNKLGLKLDFKYTMLASNDVTTYPIYSKGETVTIRITNPSAKPAYSSVISSTLKTFKLYEFSGTNNLYSPGGGKLTLYSSRLKFISDVVSGSWYDNLTAVKTWSLELVDSSLKIYRLPNTIGNPYNHKYNGNTETDLLVGPNGWNSSIETETLTFEKLAIGYNFANGAYNIRRRSDASAGQSISFFVIAKPMMKFKCVYAIANDFPSAIPYALTDTLYANASRQKTYYLSVSNSTSTYNPFAESMVYYTIENTEITHTNTPAYINNITFVESRPGNNPYKNYNNYTTSPVSTIYGITVEGSKATITLKSDLLANSSSSVVLSTILDNKPLNRGSEYSNATTSGIVNGSGYSVSLVQTTTYGSPYLYTASQILGSSLANIKFTIPTFFVDSTTIKLDLPVGPGTVVNMYTRNIIKESNVYKVVLYKYDSFSNVAPNSLDWNNYGADDKASVTVKFQSRSKKVLTVPTRAMRYDYVETMDDLLNNIGYSTVSSAWVFDLSYNDINTAPWFSFCSLTKSAMRSTLPKFFAPPSILGHAKMNIITRNKILLVKDKLGNVICELNHDGILRTPFMSTSALVNTNTNVGQSAPADLSELILRSVVGFSKKL